MPVFILFIFISSSLFGQMDTTITKDEYYELVYQLEKSRTINRMLKDRVTEMEWIVYSNDIVVKAYEERLLSMEILLINSENKKNKKKK